MVVVSSFASFVLSFCLFIYLFIVKLFFDLEFIPSCLNCILSLTRNKINYIARVELEIKLSIFIYDTRFPSFILFKGLHRRLKNF